MIAPRLAEARPRCIIYVASTSTYLALASLPLMRRMIADGWRVVALAPRDDHTPRLIAAGVEWYPVPIVRQLARPWANLRTFAALRGFYRRLQPDLVHHVTANPIIYGGAAARSAAVPAVVNTMPGLGSVFASDHWDAPLLRSWLRTAYRLVDRRPNQRTIFQNPDDLGTFVDDKVISAEHAVLITGSGVDANEFQPSSEPGGIPTILFCGRIVRFKGIDDLVAATRLLRQRRVECRLRLVGPHDPQHRHAVGGEELARWQREGLLVWDGLRSDMPAVYANANIVALPSRSEGVPRSLIEGAACARALVASDTPGCREVVIHEHNGLLVPPGNPEALAQALARLLENADERRRFGAAGRELVVRKFSRAAVIEATMKVYRDLAGCKPAD